MVSASVFSPTHSRSTAESRSISCGTCAQARNTLPECLGSSPSVDRAIRRNPLLQNFIYNGPCFHYTCLVHADQRVRAPPRRTFAFSLRATRCAFATSPGLSSTCPGCAALNPNTECFVLSLKSASRISESSPNGLSEQEKKIGRGSRWERSCKQG